MTAYYPQAGVTLRVVWEDFGKKGSFLGSNVYSLAVQPKSFDVNINSYMQADTFEVTLDYKSFPFDPRCIKSAQINIHCENMGELWKDGVLNTIKLKNPSEFPDDHNALLTGFADDEGIVLNDSTRTITFKGRDLTSIFIDAKWPGKLINKQIGTIDMVLKDIIAQLPAAGDIKLENRTGIAVLPKLSANVLDFGKLAGKSNPDRRDTYWSVMQRVAAEAAMIIYMELDTLVLTKPRTLYDRNKAVQFFYGENIKSLEFNRKIGRQKAFNVKVSSFLIEDKGRTTVSIPKESKTLPGAGKEVLVEKIIAKGGVSSTKEEPAPYLSFLVADEKNKDTLIARAEKIYEELGRQEIEGTFSTINMTSGQGNNKYDSKCFNLLKLRNGTPLTVEIRPDDLKLINKTSSESERIERLLSQGFGLMVATSLAKTISSFDTPFYTRSVNFNYSIESGLAIKVDFVNFIETEGKGLGIV